MIQVGAIAHAWRRLSPAPATIPSTGMSTTFSTDLSGAMQASDVHSTRLGTIAAMNTSPAHWSPTQGSALSSAGSASAESLPAAAAGAASASPPTSLTPSLAGWAGSRAAPVPSSAGGPWKYSSNNPLPGAAGAAGAGAGAGAGELWKSSNTPLEVAGRTSSAAASTCNGALAAGAGTGAGAGWWVVSPPLLLRHFLPVTDSGRGATGASPATAGSRCSGSSAGTAVGGRPAGLG
jgi:hypothetical protein